MFFCLSARDNGTSSVLEAHRSRSFKKRTQCLYGNLPLDFVDEHRRRKFKECVALHRQRYGRGGHGSWVPRIPSASPAPWYHRQADDCCVHVPVGKKKSLSQIKTYKWPPRSLRALDKCFCSVHWVSYLQFNALSLIFEQPFPLTPQWMLL